jgi:hypothetical protein
MRRVRFDGWLLLQPGPINVYTQAVIQTMRVDEHKRGCLVARRAKDNSPAIYRLVSGTRKQ